MIENNIGGGRTAAPLIKYKENVMSDYEMKTKFEEYKEEYAELAGFSDVPFWYENDGWLYDAECYAYDKLMEEIKGELKC